MLKQDIANTRKFSTFNLRRKCLKGIKVFKTMSKRKAEADATSELKAKKPAEKKQQSKASNKSSKPTKSSKEPKTQVSNAVKVDTDVTIKVSTSAEGSQFSLKDLVKDAKWREALSAEFEEGYFKNLEKFLSEQYAEGLTIYPPRRMIFQALNLTPLDKIKVVLLGQDPYRNYGQAMGLSFSVPEGITVLRSLKNIYTELERDPKIEGFTRPVHGCLNRWTEEGILLLNSTLTVDARKQNSHARQGWQTFTDRVIKILNENCNGVVFLLLGRFAQKKAALVDLGKHRVVQAAHPSPLSVKHFRECNCFSDVNDKLIELGQEPVNWNL